MIMGVANTTSTGKKLKCATQKVSHHFPEMSIPIRDFYMYIGSSSRFGLLVHACLTNVICNELISHFPWD